MSWRCAPERPPCAHPRREILSSWSPQAPTDPSQTSALSRTTCCWSLRLHSEIEKKLTFYKLGKCCLINVHPCLSVRPLAWSFIDLSIDLSLCLVCLFLHPSIHGCKYQSVLSVHSSLPVCQYSVCLVCPLQSACLPIHQSVYPYQFACLPVHLSVHTSLCACLSTSIWLSIHFIYLTIISQPRSQDIFPKKTVTKILTLWSS